MATSTVPRAACAKGSARTHLVIGNQIFHNGSPVELLYRMNHDNDFETWRVRPLFVEAPDRNEQFHRSDRISYLHTIRAHHRSRAA